MYLRPTSLDEALEALAATGGTILSGGTDLFPPLSDRPLTGNVIDISAIREISGIRQTDSHTIIGGRTTWTEIVKSALPRGFDGLKAAAREVGSVQIQNVGTVAGNICNASPAADGVAALMALDADVTLASRHCSRTLPLADFVRGNRKTDRRPDEILTSVQIPRRLDNSSSVFLKLGSRRYLVISIVMVAANLLTDSHGVIREALVSVGSCSAVAKRLGELEHALVGKNAYTEISGEHLQDAHFTPLSPIDDVRGSAAYRSDVVQTLVSRALTACAEKVA